MLNYVVTGIAALLVASPSALAQDGAAQAPAGALAPAKPPAAEPPQSAFEEELFRWTWSLSAYTYLVPDGDDYVQPTLMLDRDWLHLEARYNYEALDTGSVWIGYNFSFGDELYIDVTPMLGAVFGDVEGVAPGYRITAGWWRLGLYTEGEYLFDSEDSENDFFYTWSELTYSFNDFFYAGVVIQRTKVYETDFDIQRGLLLGVSIERLNFTAYVLNPDDDPTVVLGIGLAL